MNTHAYYSQKQTLIGLPFISAPPACHHPYPPYAESPDAEGEHPIPPQKNLLTYSPQRRNETKLQQKRGERFRLVQHERDYVNLSRWMGHDLAFQTGQHNHSAPVVKQVRDSFGAHEQGPTITTSDLSPGAIEEAAQPGTTTIALMNGEQLVMLPMAHGIGVHRSKPDVFETDEVFSMG